MWATMWEHYWSKVNGICYQKVTLKARFTLQALGIAKPIFLHDQVDVGGEPLFLHGPFHYMDGISVSRL